MMSVTSVASASRLNVTVEPGRELPEESAMDGRYVGDETRSHLGMGITRGSVIEDETVTGESLAG